MIFVCNKADINLRKKVEDIMPIATGHELEELEAQLQVLFIDFYMFVAITLRINLVFQEPSGVIWFGIWQGRNVLEINHPVGPFGTKVSIHSIFTLDSHLMMYQLINGNINLLRRIENSCSH